MPRAAKVPKRARRVRLSAFRHQSESHSLSAVSFFCSRIKPSANVLPSENLCGFPIPFPLWTPEWCRQNYHLGAVPKDPQLRSGTRQKFVAALSSDTEFWSGPRQSRHRSKHDCNRGGAKIIIFADAVGISSTGKGAR